MRVGNQDCSSGATLRKLDFVYRTLAAYNLAGDAVEAEERAPIFGRRACGDADVVTVLERREALADGAPAFSGKIPAVLRITTMGAFHNKFT